MGYNPLLAIAAVTLLTAAPLAVNTAASEAPPAGETPLDDSATEAAARKLFLYVTQPVPNLKITATIETHESAWTEKQIKEVVDSSHFEKRLVGHPERKKRVEALIKANMDSLRSEHSGTNISRFCEWIGPMLYRNDMLDSPSDSDPITNSFKGGKDVKYSWVNLYDTNFSDYKSWVADPESKGASVTKDSVVYMVHHLYEARVIEPENAFAFLAVVKKQESFAPALETTWLRRSFAVARSRLDDSRLKNLVNGLDPSTSFSAKLGNLDGVACVIMSFDLKEEKGAGITYYMDWPGQNHLLKVVRKIPSKGVDVTATRSGFDTNGFPHEWVVAGQTPDGPVFQKVTVIQTEVNPQWDTKLVFGTAFPSNFVVDEVSPKGLVQNLQWPADRPRPIQPVATVAHSLRWRIFFLVLFLLANVAVVLSLLKQKNKQRNALRAGKA